MENHTYGSCSKRRIFQDLIMNDKQRPFADARNTAVFTAVDVTIYHKDILYVYYDSDDGAWQFHSEKEPEESKASIVSLETIYKSDNSIGELSDLLLGYCAYRKTKNDTWIKEEMSDNLAWMRIL